jgi:hypothetical protein
MRVVRVVIACTIAVGFLSSQTDAGKAPVGGASRGGTVDLYANAIVSSGGGGGGSGPVCRWTALTRGEVSAIGGGSAGPGLTVEEQAQPATTVVGGVTYNTYAVTCPGEATTIRLVDPNVTAPDLFALVSDEVSARLPEPVHNMNPRPEVGGIVNLGLWLAVESQSIEPVRAEAGPAWIVATPTQRDFRHGRRGQR